MKKQRLVQSVDRAIQILGLLSGHSEGLGLSELSSAMELSPQTVQSLLKTLQYRELVIQLGRGKSYILGPKIHQMSREWLRGQDRAILAHGVVVGLGRELGEYVLLTELHGSHSVVLVETQSKQPLSVNGEAMSYVALNRMATGKVMMASVDAERREALLQGLKTVEAGLESDAELSQLRDELAEVAKLGHAIRIQNDIGIGSLAVPVHSVQEGVVASLGASAPLVRFSEGQQQAIRRQLGQAAKEIERRWGGSGDEGRAPAVSDTTSA